MDVQRLVLLDLNRNCLAAAQRRLARFRPQVLEASVLDLIKGELATFGSIGLAYVLHCLPGSLREKLCGLDHLLPLVGPDAVLFGATILGRGTDANGAVRVLLRLYNRSGVFKNLYDDIGALDLGLRRCFGQVEIEQRGCVALFGTT